LLLVFNGIDRGRINSQPVMLLLLLLLLLLRGVSIHRHRR
jgi:hypothetical protein